MPNILDENGLQLATRAEWIEFFTNLYKRYYGDDINLHQDTPDGQVMNITVQVILDMQDLMAQVYSSMDPDQAIGRILDQRIAINGIERQGGTYTIQPIEVNVNQSVTLYGLDSTQLPYTVADNEGNQFILIQTQAGLSPGLHVLNFRAQNPGEQLTMPNTITTPITVILGVVSVNNPSGPLQVGRNEEPDNMLKIRRRQSTSLGSQGYNEALESALKNIPGITNAVVHENKTGSVDSDGTPSHCIWVIISGSANHEDIARAIYLKRNAGANMRGETNYNLVRPNGSYFIAKWDYFISQSVFITFRVTPINPVVPVNLPAILDGLPSLLSSELSENIDINEVSTAIQVIDDNALATNIGLSDGTQQDIIFDSLPTSGNFKIKYSDTLETVSLAYNETIENIELAIRDLDGFENVVVSGSIASGMLSIDLSTLEFISNVLRVSESTLVDVSSDSVVTTTDLNYVEIIKPRSKQHQFVLSQNFVVGTPIQLLPANQSVQLNVPIQFSSYGGYGKYTYELLVNMSGGTIDAETGEYTSGIIVGNDVVGVKDEIGNTAIATVQVV